MKQISKKIGKGLLVAICIAAVVIIFYTLYDIMDYFNIGADNS